MSSEQLAALRNWARSQVLNYLDAAHQTVQTQTRSAAPDQDDLTGSLSRTAFTVALGAALRDARRDQQGVGVIVLDIDQFTSLNHLHGTDIGNEVLAETANRLAAAVRPTDRLARTGGDEFALMCRTAPNKTHTRDVAQRIQRFFDAPIETTVGPQRVTVAIGITTATDYESIDIDPASMMRDAETAAARAKSLGRSQLISFDPDMQQEADERYRTEQELRVALRDENLDVHFQPIINLNSGDVVGVEALARWHHHHLGPISPGLFIPVAEESGLIGELSSRVMAQTVAQGAEWNQTNHDTLITMNLSSRQLLDPQLGPFVKSLLELHDLQPARLCLEITESS